MQAKLISNINSDLGVVNCARVSLNKKHDVFNSNTDTKLIEYLAKHNHWTPFAHPRLYFELEHFRANERLYLYERANLSGFNIVKSGRVYYIKGSLYSFAKNLHAFRNTRQDAISDALYTFYPISAKALIQSDYPSFSYLSGILPCSESYIKLLAQDNPNFNKLLTATLLIKVPIFVARQIRTSQVGFACSDLYVENESFVFNEVSRRYVNDDPEYYEIKEWRIREGIKVKQGSTGICTERENEINIKYQAETDSKAKYIYERQMLKNIAPEQARALLPQSMYTEFYMTGTIHRWNQFIELRSKPDVQEETRYIAELIKQAIH